MNKKAKTSLIAFVVAAILIASCIGFYAYTKISDDINGKNQSDSKYTLEITKNDFQYEVSEKLAQNGMVISASAWSNWMDKHYPKFEYTNGEYYMTADMSYEEIVNKLNNPDISHKTVKVCVPEGTNAMQIAALMQDNGICSADDFLSACKKAGDYDYAFLASVPDSDLIGYQLEGFLFPATYDVGLNTPAKQVVSMMLDAFGEHLTADMTRFCEENNMTLYQLLTLASVVQEEAFGVSSAKNIASVFINRLNKGVKLQSDVTYFYARDLRDDYGFSQQVYDAYYTYRCDALPVGPISNSGDDIIDATVNAPTTDYMYFFSDLQKEFHFAKTAEEFVQLQKQFPWQ
ncbi:endolytic transglycosylase MltG [uncultured Eubacterium sp.]|uniref:endolytic transglycosylase MltG n=1 Tax=uncultured Eubacterium sp. TaxID=165185 RepID=UPI0015A81216|nr:endolytic transglycosylase MltG [uncultured Eubacterium sp.]